jgi:hypothetical protein
MGNTRKKIIFTFIVVMSCYINLILKIVIVMLFILIFSINLDLNNNLYPDASIDTFSEIFYH